MKIEQVSYASLIREVALGRQEALKVIMDRYMSMVSRTAYRIMCDRPDSEDITKAVFMKVWRNASSYDGRYSVSTWLYRITCNLCFDRLHRRRILELFSIRPSVYESSAPAAMSPEEDFITKETWAIFCRASQELSPKQRTVFTLHDLEGLSVEEVISITGMTADQIKDNLHIARKKIRQELERYGKVR
jgi:RNA polymerase sigma-70 factor (ECF subfamily)